MEKGQTHFEQVSDRALIALKNAATVFDYATNSTQLMRRASDTQTAFQDTMVDNEADLKSRLIELRFEALMATDFHLLGFRQGDGAGAGLLINRIGHIRFIPLSCQEQNQRYPQSGRAAFSRWAGN